MRVAGPRVRKLFPLPYGCGCAAAAAAAQFRGGKAAAASGEEHVCHFTPQRLLSVVIDDNGRTVCSAEVERTDCWRDVWGARARTSSRHLLGLIVTVIELLSLLKYFYYNSYISGFDTVYQWKTFENRHVLILTCIVSKYEPQRKGCFLWLWHCDRDSTTCTTSFLPKRLCIHHPIPWIRPVLQQEWPLSRLPLLPLLLLPLMHSLPALLMVMRFCHFAALTAAAHVTKSRSPRHTNNTAKETIGLCKYNSIICTPEIGIGFVPWCIRGARMAEKSVTIFWLLVHI